MTAWEGDTGAYLQYAHVRLCSVERRVAEQVVLRSDRSQINTDLLTEPKAREIIYLLATYPDVVRTTFKTLEPSTIVSFCFKYVPFMILLLNKVSLSCLLSRLSHLISSAWEHVIVMNQEQEVAQARLYLYTCARDVLASAMRLLSLTPIDRM